MQLLIVIRFSSIASLDAATAPDSATLNNEGQPVPKKANRCHVCKKRVGLTGKILPVHLEFISHFPNLFT